ncbi:MAG: Nif3-like dinuclear metal center hexameric protein [Bacteroidales bacterium]|nr:Nif3-like dinuclear metal center hexameric protein [Bacteroidales bacterium]
MKIIEITDYLDRLFIPYYQEEWDNCGLLVGDPSQEATGVLVALDVTPSVVNEAINKGCNLIASHHPIIYKGLTRITPSTELGRMLTQLVQNNICVYAAHTNLDNLRNGVSGELARRLGLERVQVLEPKNGLLKKLATYVPAANADAVREALFKAGAGGIGIYDACSYNSEGMGTFRAGEGARPFVGKIGELHHEMETKIEVIYETRMERNVVAALLKSHPYEEPAYDLLPLTNAFPMVGSGAIGWLKEPLSTTTFLLFVKNVLRLPMARTSELCKDTVQHVAVCGGSGAFLIKAAKAQGADIYLCGDLKYHDFQQAEGEIILADIGHYESEQFAKEIISAAIKEKFRTFACDISQCDKGFVSYI